MIRLPQPRRVYYFSAVDHGMPGRYSWATCHVEFDNATGKYFQVRNTIWRQRVEIQRETVPRACDRFDISLAQPLMPEYFAEPELTDEEYKARDLAMEAAETEGNKSEDDNLDLATATEINGHGIQGSVQDVYENSAGQGVQNVSGNNARYQGLREGRRRGVKRSVNSNQRGLPYASHGRTNVGIPLRVSSTSNSSESSQNTLLPLTAPVQLTPSPYTRTPVSSPSPSLTTTAPVQLTPSPYTRTPVSSPSPSLTTTAPFLPQPNLSPSPLSWVSDSTESPNTTTPFRLSNYLRRNSSSRSGPSTPQR